MFLCIFLCMTFLLLCRIFVEVYNPCIQTVPFHSLTNWGPQNEPPFTLAEMFLETGALLVWVQLAIHQRFFQFSPYMQKIWIKYMFCTRKKSKHPWLWILNEAPCIYAHKKISLFALYQLVLHQRKVCLFTSCSAQNILSYGVVKKLRRQDITSLW